MTLRRNVDGGAWTNVTAANYTYYGYQESFGGEEDLKTVTTQVWNGTAWQNTGTTYYRYYPWFLTGSSSSSSSSSSSNTGATVNPLNHLPKYVVNPAAFDRIVAAGLNPLTVSDATLSTYADYYFEYDTSRRVTKEIVQSGSQTFLFAYAQSAFGNGYNAWSTKTIETLPDGNQNIVFSNYAGQTMLELFVAGTSQWLNFYQYDGAGHITLQANPSAISGFDETKADLLNFNSGTGKYQYLRDNAGLIHTMAYDLCSGYMTRDSVQQGQLGTSIKLREYKYICCGGNCNCSSSSSSSSSKSSSSTSSSSSSSSLIASLGVSYLSQTTDYPSDTDPTKTIVTSYAYTFYSGTCRIQQKTITLPVISTAQNGSGIAATRKEYFDIYGNQTWSMDERGFIRRTAFDIPTGAVSQQVADVDTSMFPDTPSGWSTPSGGGLNLVTDLTFDTQGRTTQILQPTHTIDLGGAATVIRTAAWTVYDDPNHVRYSGLGYATGTSPSYTYKLINPVSIVKMDAGGRINEQIQAAASSTAGSLATIIVAAGSGAAAFPQSSYTRWTTNQYTDCCLSVSQRVYRLIPASGAGVSGTNYDETNYGYDVMKRRNRTVTPGGTITDLVYDVRGLGESKGVRIDGRTTLE